MGANLQTGAIFKSFSELNARFPMPADDAPDTEFQSKLEQRNAQLISVENTQKSIEEWTQKAISDSDFSDGSSGKLAPETDNVFDVKVRTSDDAFMKDAYWKRMGKLVDSVPKMILGGIYTKGDGGSAVSYDKSPLHGAPAVITAAELVTSWAVRWNAEFAQISLGDYKRLLADAMFTAFGQNFATAIWRGDKTAYASDSTDLGLLLKTMNGFDQQAQNLHRVDAAGSLPGVEFFEAMFRRMPADYRMAKDLAWACNPIMESIWRAAVSARTDEYGASAARGSVLPPLGIPWNFSGKVPFTKALVSANPTPGYQVSPARGPWLVDSTNKNFKFNIDAVAALTVDILTTVLTPQGLTKGLVYPHELANAANDALKLNATYIATGRNYSNVFYDDGEGHLIGVSPQTGTGAIVDIDAAASADITPTLGWASPPSDGGTGTGAASGGSSPIGTVVVLTPKSNFAIGLVNANSLEGAARADARYNQDVGAVQSVLRAAGGCTFRDKYAVVYGKNIPAWVTTF